MEKKTIPQKEVDRSTYLAWEKGVIERFFKPDRTHTHLIPTDGSPAVVVKDKVVLAVTSTTSLPSDVEANKSDVTLQEKQKINLWHIGKQKLDGVSWGLDGQYFKYAALDLGGLTNCKQKLGSPIEFEETGYKLSADSDLQVLSEILIDRWSTLIKKELTGPLSGLQYDIKDEICKWLRSVQEVFKCPVHLLFFRIPQEHRVLVTSHDVKTEMGGMYYNRVFGDDDKFAVETECSSDLFCAVAEQYVTPNYNLNNIRLEVRTYEVSECEDSGGPRVSSQSSTPAEEDLVVGDASRLSCAAQ